MRYSDAKRVLTEIGVTPDRRLGQHFLVNGILAARIARAASPDGEGTVLEIGPGLGALTSELLGVARSVTAVEISKRMSAYLAGRFPPERLTVVNGDFLKTDPAALPGYPFPVVAGNLPYSISSPLLLRLVESAFSAVHTAVLMLQKEVAVRASCISGGRDYGRLSLQLWPVYSVTSLLDAGPGDFYPPPEVFSRVIVLTRREEPLVEARLFDAYRRIVRVSFSSRRKTILNNLAPVFGREGASDLLETAGIEPGLRAEEMDPGSFLRLAELSGP